MIPLMKQSNHRPLLKNNLFFNYRNYFQLKSPETALWGNDLSWLIKDGLDFHKS